MLSRLISATLVLCLFRLTVPAAAQTPAQPSATISASPATDILSVPAGTLIPAPLVTPTTKQTRPGATLRAQVAFPVLTGSQLAIPVGTYIEGVLEPPPAATKKNKFPPPVLHFTKLLFADGSTVSLDATAVSAGVTMPPAPAIAPEAPRTAESSSDDFIPTGHGGGGGMELSSQQTTTYPSNPFAHSGPNPAVFYGPIIAVAVVFIALLLGRRSALKANRNSFIHGAGWQFNLTVQQPFTVDATHVSASAAIAPH
jgi:hypothetical protein